MFHHEHRIQDVAVGLLYRHLGLLPTLPAPKEDRAIRFILERSIARGIFNSELRCPDRPIVIRTEPAPCEYGAKIGARFGLYEELVESWVCTIPIVRSKA